LPVAHRIGLRDVISETELTTLFPSTKYTVPATFAVTVTALGQVLPRISVGANETEGIIKLREATEDVVSPTRTHVSMFPVSHFAVTGQRSTPEV
jgi:hypothetical protein